MRSSEIRDRSRMYAFITPIQHHTGIPSHCNKRRKIYKKCRLKRKA